MKKTTLFAAMVALLAIVSCHKEENPSQTKDPVFTAIIENPTAKTTIDVVNKKVEWVKDDEITVTDASNNSVKYAATEINEGVATFKKKSGETGTLGAGPYTAVYGSAPSASQTYSTSAPSLPMTGVSGESDNKLTFTVSCGLLVITLTQTGESIKKILVSDNATPPNTYTLDCGDGVSIASGAKFYFALPKGTYTSFQFTNGSNVIRGRAGLSIAMLANHINPVSSNFAPKYTSGTTDADYSVEIGGTCWAPVNCGYDATDYPYGKLFQWGRKFGQPYESGNIEAVSMSKSDDTEENKNKHGYNANVDNWFKGDLDNTLWNGNTKGESDPCPSGWRVPTKDELYNLMQNHSDMTEKDGQKGYYFSGSTTYSDSVPRVFLPAAGFRFYNPGNANGRGNVGNYWSSSIIGSYAYYLSLNANAVTINNGGRAYGFSIRCVKE